MSDVTTIIPALTGLLGGILAVWFGWRLNVGKQVCLSKVQVTTVNKLSAKPENKQPLYIANKIRGVRGASLPVYDKADYSTTVVYKNPTNAHDFRFETLGDGCDAIILSPWHDELIFNYKSAKENLKNILMNYSADRKPSTVFSMRTTVYNGLQQGNEDIQTKVDCFTKNVKLIVDYSNLPNFENIFLAKPKGSHTRGGFDIAHPEPKEHRPGVWVLSGEDLLRGDTLKLDVTINWDLLERGSQ